MIISPIARMKPLRHRPARTLVFSDESGRFPTCSGSWGAPKNRYGSRPYQAQISTRSPLTIHQSLIRKFTRPWRLDWKQCWLAHWPGWMHLLEQNGICSLSIFALMAAWPGCKTFGLQMCTTVPPIRCIRRNHDPLTGREHGLTVSSIAGPQDDPVSRHPVRIKGLRYNREAANQAHR